MHRMPTVRLPSLRSLLKRGIGEVSRVFFQPRQVDEALATAFPSLHLKRLLFAMPTKKPIHRRSADSEQLGCLRVRACSALRIGADDTLAKLQWD